MRVGEFLHILDKYLNTDILGFLLFMSKLQASVGLYFLPSFSISIPVNKGPGRPISLGNLGHVFLNFFRPMQHLWVINMSLESF
jgi:hypothetical protein